MRTFAVIMPAIIYKTKMGMKNFIQHYVFNFEISSTITFIVKIKALHLLSSLIFIDFRRQQFLLNPHALILIASSHKHAIFSYSCIYNSIAPNLSTQSLSLFTKVHLFMVHLIRVHLHCTKGLYIKYVILFGPL